MKSKSVPQTGSNISRRRTFPSQEIFWADVYLFQSCLLISLLAITANFAASSTPNYQHAITSYVFFGSLVWYNNVLNCGIILKILHNVVLTALSYVTFRYVCAHVCAHTHTLSKLTRLVSNFWTLSKHLSSSNAPLVCFPF